MSASSSSRSARAICLLAACVLCHALAAPPARAQDGGAGASGDPIRLGPIDPDTPERDAPAQGDGRPTTSGGTGSNDTGSNGTGSGGTGGSTATPDEPGTGGDGQGLDGIEVDRLDAPDTETMGTLSPDGGGLDPAMWADTPRRVVTALMPRLPANLRAPVLRDLARRLLLSGGEPPPTRQTPENGAPNLLELRVERLMALGDYGGVAALMKVVPRGALTDPLRRAHVTARLVRGDTEAACPDVRQALSNSRAMFWQQALVVCHAARGAFGQADLAVSLMRESEAGDAAFIAAYDAVAAGLSLTTERLPPLAVALLVNSDTGVPEDPVASLDPGLQAAVAGHAATAPVVRARAAELAAAAGALAPDTLRQRYAALAFPTSRIEAAAQMSLSNAPPTGPSLTATERRALRYQAVRRDNGAATRAELIEEVTAEAPPRLYPALVDAFLPFLKADAPRPDLIWFAGTAGRAFYGAGQPEAATRWLMTAREEAVISPDAAAALTALWPYARLSGATAVPINGGLAAWREAQDTAPPRLALQESLLRAAFEALEERDPRRWVEIAGGPAADARPVPPAAVIYALREAGNAGRLGEVVLLALIGLGATDLSNVHPLMLNTALTALRRVDLEPTARRIAIAAALANGI
jgi:hypothetical protein